MGGMFLEGVGKIISKGGGRKEADE